MTSCSHLRHRLHRRTQLHQRDREAYIERVGGPEEAERRRKALMARQSGQRLAEERKQRGLAQAQLAQTMGVTPGRGAQIERGELSTIVAIARYVQALGGHLELVANFAGGTKRGARGGARSQADPVSF
jgi:ribosome-binding protein aMBF1 (putative translation factor)